MATNDYTNSVPLGTAGTGGAYVLPTSQAANNIGDYADTMLRMRQQQQMLAQRRAQEIAQAWSANQLKIKGGTLFQKEINDRAAQVMEMGLNLQKAGINPNAIASNPETQAQLEKYQNAKAMLLRDVDIRDDIVKQSTDNEKLLSSKPAGFFDTESVQKYQDYISGKIPLSEISAKGLTMPGLREAFNLQPLIEKLPESSIKTTSLPINGVQRTLVLPNEEAHAKVASGLVNSNPEVQADIEKKAGVPFNQIGNETNPQKLEKMLDDHYRSYPDQLAQNGVFSYQDPKYKELISGRAKAMATAAKVKKDYINDIKTQLDNRVDVEDKKELNFEYQKEQDRRQRLGMEIERFSDWKKNKQFEAGSFSFGNQESFVPVVKERRVNGKLVSTDEDGKPLPSVVQPERGASLYGVNLPAVRLVVRPSAITDVRTGKTAKNTSPVNVTISQIQMVPVFKGLAASDQRNGSEVSARQLKEIVEGKHKAFSLDNIEFKPFAYGIKNEHDAANVHTVNTPIKFSYDALQGSDVKKINTTTFDEATQGLRQLQENPKFRRMSPQDQLDFISKKYNVKFD